MATLKKTLTLTSTAGTNGVSEDANLALSVSDTLSVTDPSVGISKLACSAAGGDNIILPSSTNKRWVYIKNTGLDSLDAATTASIQVETGDSAGIITLDTDEFCFFPFKIATGGLLQIEASSGTVVVEYAYWTST
jgi:hypothetical protein